MHLHLLLNSFKTKTKISCFPRIFWPIIFANYCVKYAKMNFFSDPYFLVKGQTRWCCPYTEKYRSKKTRILAFLLTIFPVSHSAFANKPPLSYQRLCNFWNAVVVIVIVVFLTLFLLGRFWEPSPPVGFLLNNFWTGRAFDLKFYGFS